MLKAFSPDDFPILNQWVNSEALLQQFSGDVFPFPLQLLHIQNYSLQYPERQFYIAFDDLTGDPFGFGEIIPQKDNVPRLGRLLIGDVSLRGKGLGKKLVQLLIDECRKKFNTNTVELYVLSDNIPAIKCYKALGFTFITGDETNILLGDTPKVMKKMRLVLL